MSLNLRLGLNSPRGLLLIGLAIREVLCFWTGHPYDMEVWIRNSFFVSAGQNPYESYMPPVPGLSFAFLNDQLPGVGYLPLWPLLGAGLYRLFALVPGTNRFVLYFLLKQPPVVGDTVLGLMIYRAILHGGGSPAIALRGIKFWMFFPYAIAVSALWGMFDSVVAALYLAFLLTNWTWKGHAGVGLAILLKWLPVIYLPYHLLRQQGARRLGPVVSVGVPLGFTALVFFVAGWDYAGITAMAQFASHGGGAGMTYVSLLRFVIFHANEAWVGYVYLLVGFVWVPAVILGAIAAARRFPDGGTQATVQGVLFLTILFFLSRWGINEQYLVYLLPLFYVDVLLWHPERKSLFSLTWILGFAFLLANNNLLIWFFAPAFPQAFDLAFAFDNWSDLAWVRYAALYTLSALFTIHLVQLARIFVRSESSPTPWLWRPLARLQSVLRVTRTDVSGGP